MPQTRSRNPQTPKKTPKPQPKSKARKAGPLKKAPANKKAVAATDSIQSYENGSQQITFQLLMAGKSIQIYVDWELIYTI